MNRLEMIKELCDSIGLEWYGLELGTATGAFTRQILDNIEGGILWTVDKWVGDGRDGSHNVAEYIETLLSLEKYGSRVRVLRTAFEAALGELKREKFDFVYLDGYAHLGNGGPDFLRLVYSYVKPGGLFGVHDYDKQWPDNIKTIDAFAKEEGIDNSFLTSGDKYSSWAIRKKSDPVFESDSLAIVGNGPCDLGNGCGDEIDSHDIVIRMNNYVIEGYEKDYGSKTTHWACNFLDDIVDIEGRTDNIGGEVFCMLPLLSLQFRGLNGYSPNYDVFEKVLNSSNLRILPWWIFNWIRGLSSGAMLLLWLYMERGMSLDGVDIYGFDAFTSDAHHYWSDDTEDTAHNSDIEKKIVKILRSDRYYNPCIPLEL